MVPYKNTENWSITRSAHEAWWRGEGLVISAWLGGIPRDWSVDHAPRGSSMGYDGFDTARRHNDPAIVTSSELARVDSMRFPLHMFPLVFPDVGTVSLAPILGSGTAYGLDNVWYRPDVNFGPRMDRPLAFREDNRSWRVLSNLCSQAKLAVGNRAFVGCPAVSPNLDVLAELRGVERLMFDLVDDPGWVHAKLEEIQICFEEVYSRLYRILQEPDGSLVFAYFMLFAPGTVCLGQCDTAALISLDMFEEFVIPALRRQCNFLDYCMYHVDGPTALKTVDPLLEVESLSAIEFTPGPNVPGGGDPHWFGLYRKIKAAGKSIQVVLVEPDELERLLDEIGPDGTYVLVRFHSDADVEQVLRIAERFTSVSSA